MNSEAGSKARGAWVKAYGTSILAHSVLVASLWSGVWSDSTRSSLPAVLEVELQGPIRFEARAAGPVSRHGSSLTSGVSLGGQERRAKADGKKAGDGGQARKTPRHSPEGRAEETGGKALSAKPSGKPTSAQGASAPSPSPSPLEPSLSQVVPAQLEPQAVVPDRQATAQRGLGEDDGREGEGKVLIRAFPAAGAAGCCSSSAGAGEGSVSREGASVKRPRTGIGNGTGGGPGVAGGGGHERTGLGGLDRLLLEYLHDLHRRISEHKSYPLQARRLSMEGTVRVGLAIRCDGQLAQVELLHGSPFNVLNIAALETVQKVTPLPPLPVGTCLERMRVLIPFTYRLER